MADEFGRTSVDGISVAGDGRGILGAAAAAFSGQLAGIDAAFALGRIDADRRARLCSPVKAQLARASRGRTFLDVLYRPAPGYYADLADEVLACRCEEVTVGAVRRERRPLVNINAVKSRVRCGMGPCQGRFCETIVRELLLMGSGADPASVGQLRIRPPIKPVPIEELMALGDEQVPPEAAIGGKP